MQIVKSIWKRSKNLRHSVADGAILQKPQFYWPPKLVLCLGLIRRVGKSLHFRFAKGLETKSFLVALLLTTGFVLDWMKAYLVYSPQNVRLLTSPFCLETEKSVDSSLVCI